MRYECVWLITLPALFTTSPDGANTVTSEFAGSLDPGTWTCASSSCDETLNYEVCVVAFHFLNDPLLWFLERETLRK